MKKVILQICVSSLILSLIFVKVDWHVLIAACKKINFSLFLISTGVALSNVFVNSSKFHLLLKNTRLSLPVMRLVKINLIARAYAVLIPTSLGPAAVRWYKVTKNKQGKSFFLATTIIERVFFLLVMVLCGTLPLLLYTQHTQIILLRQKLFSLIIVTYGILSISLIYFLVPRIHQACMRFTTKILSIKQGGKLSRFLTDFSLNDLSYKTIGMLFLFSLLWQLVFLCRIYLLFKAIDLPLSFLEAVWMGSLVMLLQVLPVSFSGLGVREGAYAFLFTLFGLPAEQGVAIGLLFFIQTLVLVSIGAVLNLFEK